jgi:hypothetical protein
MVRVPLTNKEFLFLGLALQISFLEIMFFAYIKRSVCYILLKVKSKDY